MTTLQVIEIVRRLDQGMTRPFLVRAEDDAFQLLVAVRGQPRGALERFHPHANPDPGEVVGDGFAQRTDPVAARRVARSGTYAQFRLQSQGSRAGNFRHDAEQGTWRDAESDRHGAE